MASGALLVLQPTNAIAANIAVAIRDFLATMMPLGPFYCRLSSDMPKHNRQLKAIHAALTHGTCRTLAGATINEGLKDVAKAVEG